MMDGARLCGCVVASTIAAAAALCLFAQGAAANFEVPSSGTASHRIPAGTPSSQLLPPSVPTLLDDSAPSNAANVSSVYSSLTSRTEPSPPSAASIPADALSPAEYEALLRSVSDLDPGSGRSLSAISSGASASELRWMLVTHSRRKRNVVQLGDMMKCATGCSPIAYKGYGCYCGFLGSGNIVDGIDQCCYYHDKCYQQSSCPSLLQYFAQYPWFCANETPICSAVSTGSTCARELCECDRQFAKCLRRFPCPQSRPVCTSSPLRHWQNLFLGMRKANSREKYHTRLDNSYVVYE